MIPPAIGCTRRADDIRDIADNPKTAKRVLKIR
jgi:hypothetical protein